MTQSSYRLLLKEKTDLLHEYKNVTKQIQIRLNQKDTDALAACMKARGRLINRISRLDHRLMPEGSYPRPRDAESGRGVAAMLKDMQALLTSIASIEKECLHSAGAEWRVIKDDILAARQSKKRTRGYHKAVGRPARFVDTRVT